MFYAAVDRQYRKLGGKVILEFFRDKRGKASIVKVGCRISEGRIVWVQRKLLQSWGRGSEREDGSGGLRGSQTLSSDATAMNRAGEESETSSAVGSDYKGACPHTRGEERAHITGKQARHRPV